MKQLDKLNTLQKLNLNKTIKGNINKTKAEQIT